MTGIRLPNLESVLVSGPQESRECSVLPKSRFIWCSEAAVGPLGALTDSSRPLISTDPKLHYFAREMLFSCNYPTCVTIKMNLQCLLWLASSPLELCSTPLVETICNSPVNNTYQSQCSAGLQNKYHDLF